MGMKSKFQAYVALTKPRISSLVLVTSAIGFVLGSRSLGQESIAWGLFFTTLAGTLLSCAGAAALNSFLERDVDAKMVRTCKRPLPLGVLQPADALGFGVLLVGAGVALLAWQVNLLTGFLALLTAFLYVLVYTPLKRITWLNTMIGAIPGALPPLGGWCGATGSLDLGAWILFAILFLWQHPHFYSIAWMYKDDYRDAGFKMLPSVEPSGKRMFRHIIGFSLVLIPVSLLPVWAGMSGWYYGFGALALGIFMLYVGVRFSVIRSAEQARKLLRASVLYLPLLLILIVSDLPY